MALSLTSFYSKKVPDSPQKRRPTPWAKFYINPAVIFQVKPHKLPSDVAY